MQVKLTYWLFIWCVCVFDNKHVSHIEHNSHVSHIGQMDSWYVSLTRTQATGMGGTTSRVFYKTNSLNVLMQIM